MSARFGGDVWSGRRGGFPIPSVVLVVLSVLVTAACGDSPSAPAVETPVASVEVLPEELDLQVGETLDLQGMPFSATGQPLLDRAVTWSSQDASVVTVSAAGRVRGIAEGRAEVYAKVGAVTGKSVVTVRDPNAATPVVTGLSPASVEAGSAAFDLTVTGTGFAAGARVLWGGEPRQTLRLSATRLRASIPAGDVADAGTADVLVENPPFGGPASEPFVFTITVPSPGPRPGISGLEPTSVPAGSAGFTLTVRGQRFAEGAGVLWNGSPRTTVRVSDTELRVEIAPIDVWSQGPAPVTVVNPDVPGSDPKTFTVGPSGVAAVAVSPRELSLDPDDEGTLLARPLAADMSPLEGRHIAWSSTNRNVIEVFGDGSYRAMGGGTARVRAQTADQWSEIDVAVRPRPVAWITVGPGVSVLLVGQQLRLEATAYDATGAKLEDRLVTWTTDDPGVATVDAGGTVTALAKGTVRIRAHAEGRTGYAVVEVRQWPTTPVWTFDLRWRDVGQLPPVVGDTTWVDATGARRTAPMVLVGAVLTHDRVANRYAQRFTLRVEGMTQEVYREESGATGYDWATGGLLFVPAGEGGAGRAFAGRLSGPGEMTVTQRVGTAPSMAYLYVVR